MEYSRPRKDDAELAKTRGRLSGTLPGAAGPGIPDGPNMDAEAVSQKRRAENSARGSFSPEAEHVATANRASRKAFHEQAQKEAAKQAEEKQNALDTKGMQKSEPETNPTPSPQMVHDASTSPDSSTNHLSDDELLGRGEQLGHGESK